MSRWSTIYIISKVAITENNHQIGERVVCASSQLLHKLLQTQS